MIVREHLHELRVAVSELSRLVSGEPNDVAIGDAWRQVDKIKSALGNLTPNHPALRERLRTL